MRDALSRVVTHPASALLLDDVPARFASPEEHIGIGALAVLVGTGTLVTHALGSCVGVCLYDSSAKVAGMLHAMLPSVSLVCGGEATPHKFADAGIAALRELMIQRGANPLGLRAKCYGGAQMFQSGGELLAVGKRNALAARKTLWKLKIAVAHEDVGGREARTLHMDVATGRVRVSNGKGGSWS